MTAARPRCSEASIQETCSEFLALDGWRRIRTDMKQLRGMGVQEKGMADDLYIRYPRGERVTRTFPYFKVFAQVMWVEWKRKTGKAMAHQKAWHDAERARGALTLIAGLDFEASIEGFTSWYEKSGLCRRVK